MFLLVLMGASLAGCGMVGGPRTLAPVVAVAPVAAPVLGVGQTAAALDTSTAAERAEAVVPAAGGASLGAMVVALGSPTEQGFWLRSDKVAIAGKGRVVTAGGATVAVDLRPGTGGALLSLAAFRALNLGLTDLPEVEVFAD